LWRTPGRARLSQPELEGAIVRVRLIVLHRRFQTDC
jgi:hypothetical protein